MGSIEERWVELNGCWLWTARQGSGPPLVLLHGGPGMWDGFDELAAMVEDLVTVHRYDQRGSGRSQGGPPYTVATFVADLEALRAHWGHDRWMIGGHSAGANLALAYAITHPQHVDAILYLGGTGLIDDWSAESHANADARRSPEQRARLAELRALLTAERESWTMALDHEYCTLTWMADFADRDRAYELAAQLLRPYGPSYEVNAAMNQDWRRVLSGPSFVAAAGRIAAPVLVVHGEEDPRPLRLARRLAASLPNASLVAVPGAGHWPWLENPEVVRGAVRTFLRDVTDRRQAGGQA